MDNGLGVGVGANFSSGKPLTPLAALAVYNNDSEIPEVARGEGFETVEMQFLADVALPCPVCRGKRFDDNVLSVRHRGKTIADILDSTIDEALTLWADQRGIVRAPPTELQVDGVGVRLEGSIDLYLWAADLTLHRADGRDLRLVGPLDRPQVRLVESAAPGPSAPDKPARSPEK